MTELKPRADSISTKATCAKVWWLSSGVVGVARGAPFTLMTQKSGFQTSEAVNELSALQVVTADERVLLPEGCDKTWNNTIANSNISALFDAWEVTKDGRNPNADATATIDWEESAKGDEPQTAHLQFIRKVAHTRFHALLL